MGAHEDAVLAQKASAVASAAARDAAESAEGALVNVGQDVASAALPSLPPGVAITAYADPWKHYAALALTGFVAGLAVYGTVEFLKSRRAAAR